MHSVIFATLRGAARVGLCVALLAPLASQAALSTDQVPLTTVKAEVVPVIWRVQLEGRVSVRLENPDLTLEIGRQLPLFQQTDREYVAIVDGQDGLPTLAVFPRVTSGGYTAWISAERQIVFSQRTRSLVGSFHFDENETLPLVRETPQAFVVEVERYGRRIKLAVPRQTKGVNLVPVPLAEPKPAVAVSTPVPVTAPAATAPSPVVMPPTSSAPEVTVDEDSQELSVEQIKNEVLSGIMVEVEKLRHERATKQAAEAEAAAKAEAEQRQVAAAAVPEPPPVVVTQVVQVVTREIPMPAPAPPPLQSGSWFEAMLAFYDAHAIRLLQGCVAILLVLLLIVEVGRRRKREPVSAPMPAKSTAVNQVSTLYSVSSVGESVTHGLAPQAGATALPPTPAAPRPKPTPAASTQHADLGGTLDGAMLPQVVQYFTSSRESGRLRIRREDGTEEYLFFDSGRIIDAQSSGLNGRDAAHRILLRRGGSFVFSRGDCTNHPRTIREDSMAILLEAHQMMDEQADGRRG